MEHTLGVSTTMSRHYRQIFWMIPLMSTFAATEEVRPGVLRTPDERFENLADYPFAPHYVEIQGYRVHYLDEGPREGRTVLLLHGEPTWSYLYRKMVPALVAKGYRCIVPDLFGFGRSDKPADIDVHTYAFHVGVITELVKALDLKETVFFGQDWGGLIGLRVVAENPDRFAAVVIANTGLPTGDETLTPAFAAWREMARRLREKGDMRVGELVGMACQNPDVIAGYDAPFPDARYKAGPLAMPQLVPMSPDNPARDANRAAWDVFRQWQKPFVTAFGDSDPITGGGDKKFQREVPGAQNRKHHVLEKAGHFLQETHFQELAGIIDQLAREG